ncbi:hypothetical protein BKK51_07565 [Rodentibacter trehalosifermentans]|uniref:Glycosyl transferase family 1 domain-containing protein n=1 Tax=Rodentibacter trehalosifermentans TaxID=1908263 RepID=A0A1V3IT34_9PAST|nr:glycosyltransferase [Rodentibacter trehalosifermentans]OOF45079.1 hypothetical protein BKK51_07565 [Rodentibacter trehalosifermentans]
MKKIDILYVDPIGKIQSGISCYIQQASKLMSATGIITYILTIKQNENIEDFRKRVALFVRENLINLIESPETLHSTKYVEHPKIHIRLHGSKSIGNYFQSLNIRKGDIIEEQNIIEKAKYVSAPSAITEFFSRKVLKIKKDIIIYPNPFYSDNIKNKKNSLKKDQKEIFFIGRGEYLKGIHFIPYLSEFNINFIGDNNLKRFLNKHLNPNEYSFVDGSNGNFISRISLGDIVVVPSLFETWSMVALEALSAYALIVIWSHLGICEYFSKPIDSYIAKPWDIQDFCLKLKMAINQKNNNEQYRNDINLFFDKINSEFIETSTNIFKDNLTNFLLKPTNYQEYPKPINIKQIEGESMRTIKKSKNYLENLSFFLAIQNFSYNYIKIKT